MPTITQNIDSDTFRINGKKVRLLGADGAESVHSDSSRNTGAGKAASNFAKVIAPVSTEVRVESSKWDMYSRALGDIKLKVGDREVDYALLLADQGFTEYHTKFGIHDNPLQHEVMKNYFSDERPFEYKQAFDKLGDEEMNSIARGLSEFTATQAQYEKGEVSREVFEEKMADVYGTGTKVPQYRYQLANWSRDRSLKQGDTDESIMWNIAMKDPKVMERYNKAMASGSMGSAAAYEASPDFWERFGATFTDLNGIATNTEQQNLLNARKFGSMTDNVMSDAQLTEGLGKDHAALILAERATAGEDAALTRKQNLLDNLSRQGIMDETPFYEQILYAIPAILADPAALVGGVGISSGAKAVGVTIDQVLKGSANVAAKAAVAFAAGAAETSIESVGRVAVDDTYSSKDFLIETAFGGALGLGIGAIAHKAGSVFAHQAESAAIMQNVQRDMTAARTAVLNTEQPLPPPRIPEQPPVVEGVTAEVVELTSADKIADMLAAGAPLSSLHKAAHGATGSAVESLGKAATTLNRSMTERFLMSDNKAANFVGTYLLELPQGYGGKVQRGFSAGLRRASKTDEYMQMIQPSYHKKVAEFAAEGGQGRMGQFMASVSAGQDNAVVRQFSRGVMQVVEARRLGRPVPKGIAQSQLDYADDWAIYMGKQHDDLVGAGIKGFHSGNKVQHYMPRAWNRGNIQLATQKHGKAKVVAVLHKAMLATKKETTQANFEASQQSAVDMLNDILSDVTGEMNIDPTRVMDSRAKQRMEIDMDTELDGLHLMDLIENDLSTVSAKYSNRAAGWVGISDATGGNLSSVGDIDALRQSMLAEGADKDLMQMFQDTEDMLFGRPTRDGLHEEVRMFKDAIALSKMGGLGMAQLTEAGNVITRTLFHAISDPKAFKKIWSMAGERADNVALMRETQTISKISNDIDLLDRQSTHLDQAKMLEIGKVRQVSLKIANLATFGALKAPAARMLSSGSGFNAIRRYERRITNASFMIDTAKHFNSGTGKMGNARMADIGLTDLDGNNDGLRKVFTDGTVEMDAHGLPTKLNIDKWPKEVLEQYHLAMYRDDAQMVQRTIVGELPVWMNKPMMSVISQFKQQALLSQKKQLARETAFADKEAVYGLLINTMMAGMVRGAKFATLGLGVAAVTGQEWEIPTGDQMQAHKYIQDLGVYADVYDMGSSAYRGIDENTPAHEMADAVASQIPMYDYAKDYLTVLNPGTPRTERIDAVKGITILGNMALADVLVAGIKAKLEE